MIDRVAPSRRPDGRLVGLQRWSSLLFMHWEVRAEEVRKLLPKELQLDLFEGTAYVGIVPFKMERLWQCWWPKSCGLRFLETNLRTYVTHQDRPGIYFFSLEANSRWAVCGARAFWSLPYFYSQASIRRSGPEVHFETCRPGGAGHRVHYAIGEDLSPSEPGSLQHFLLERYLLFVQRHGQMYSGHVHHVPYPAQAATIIDAKDGLFAAAGLPAATQLPVLAHYSPGVDVEIFSLARG